MNITLVVLLDFCCVDMEHKVGGSAEPNAEVGWYILGENQQHVGPYVSSELLGELKFVIRNCCILENVFQLSGFQILV